MSQPRNIVVFGATGVQGTATIKYLAQANTPSPKWNVLALTRNPDSASSKHLASLPGVQVIKVAANCMDEPDKAFEAIQALGVAKGEVYGCVSIQGYVDDKAMVRQGTAIADAAHAFGVKHLVYSSVDFGGLEETGVAEFEAKRNVEKYITALPIGHTFLRPTHFMSFFLPDPHVPSQFKIGRTVTLRHTFTAGSGRKVHLISPDDIGKAAARAFEEGPEWLGGVVRLAGDELSGPEIEKVYKEVFGHDIPLTNGLLTRLVKRFVPVVREMAASFSQRDYKVDLAETRKAVSEPETFRAYLERWKAEHHA